MTSQLDAALDLLRRLPPHQAPDHLAQVATLLNPGDRALLQATVDLPAERAVCKQTGRDFLVADYNRRPGQVRSPWSGQWQAATENGTSETAAKAETDLQAETDLKAETTEGPCKAERPCTAETDAKAEGPCTAETDAKAEAGETPAELRQLEVVANQAFDTYRQLYYEGGISSVYCWPLPGYEAGNLSSNWAMAILIQKQVEDSQWNSFHVCECRQPGSYDLCSTVLLHLPAPQANQQLLDTLHLNGQLCRPSHSEHPLPADQSSTTLIHHHVCHLGRQVEEGESRLRSNLQEIYFGKTHDIINELRTAVPPGYLRRVGQVKLKKEGEGEGEGKGDEKGEEQQARSGEGDKLVEMRQAPPKMNSVLAAHGAIAQEMMAKMRERQRLASLQVGEGEGKEREKEGLSEERSHSIA